MAGAGNQRQRHGVSDVGAHNSRCGHLWKQKEQYGDADRRRTDRGRGHEDAHRDAEQNGQRAGPPFLKLVGRTRANLRSNSQVELNLSAPT